MTQQTYGTLGWLFEAFRYDLESQVKRKTVRYYCDQVRLFVEWMRNGGTDAEARCSVTKQDILRFFHEIMDQPYSHVGLNHSSRRKRRIQATRRHYYRALKRFFKWAKGEGHVEQNPMDGIRIVAPQSPPIEPYRAEHVDFMLQVLENDWSTAHTDRQRLLAARDESILLMFLESGLRLSELAELEFCDLDLHRSRALVRNGKMGKGREVGFGIDTKKALWRYLGMQRPLTEIEMELARTKKELVEVRMERDILKKAAAYFARESFSRRMMKELRLHYPFALVRRILSVSASGYYAWLDRPLSKWAREEARLEVEIRAADMRTRQVCGAEKLQYDLAEHGVRVGICRIKRIRRKLGIRCRQKRRFKATTNSKHTLPVAENILGQQFKVAGPNKVWVSDITYVPTDEGWLYVAGHKDLFTGNIVGYAMGERLTRNLVSQSLLRAVAAKRPHEGLVHHSDRGSQYCSHEFRRILERYVLTASMSRKGNCFDNAPMESFWGTLKQELVHHRRYRTRKEAIQDITEYIEVFYNRQRRQARLGFLSPVVYEQRYYAGLLAA